MTEIATISVEGRRVTFIVKTGETDGIFSRRVGEPVVAHRDFENVLRHLELVIREALGEPFPRLPRTHAPPQTVADAAFVRGYVAAVAEFARIETTPVWVLRSAGISKEMAEEAGAVDDDLEVLEEHWPKESDASG